MAQPLVIKIGGGAGLNLDAICRDLAALVKGGQALVVVHGGSHETNVISERLGKPPRFVTSASGYTSRYTDAETLDVFAMVYAGKANKRLVERLQKLGVNAVGLTGVDGRLLEGPRKASIRIVEDGKTRILRDDYTGKVERVNVGLLQLLLGQGYLPVVAPLAISYEGEAMNVDGDRAAAAIAAALAADTLVILSNVPGLLARFPDESSLIPRLAGDEVASGMALAEGRMKKKVMGAAEALSHGVRRVVFADGRIVAPVAAALAGQGTVIE